MTVELRPGSAGEAARASDLFVPARIDIRRCWVCRSLRPRAAMQWRSREDGPRWNPRQLRVLCCPDCLNERAA